MNCSYPTSSSLCLDFRCQSPVVGCGKTVRFNIEFKQALQSSSRYLLYHPPKRLIELPPQPFDQNAVFNLPWPVPFLASHLHSQWAICILIRPDLGHFAPSYSPTLHPRQDWKIPHGKQVHPWLDLQPFLALAFPKNHTAFQPVP